MMDRLNDIQKGTLAEVCGPLSQNTSQSGEPFIEVKVRRLKIHSKAKGGSSPNPAEGKDVIGYEQEAYMSSEPDDFPF